MFEKDLQFDLNSNESNERLMAKVRGKVPRYSLGLRRGISETLAFLAIHSSKLKHCTQYRPEYIVNSVIKELLDNNDWKLWASLNNVLPTLAEAAPDQFLESVENALNQSPCPFDNKDGVTNTRCLIALYWALETLAWS